VVVIVTRCVTEVTCLTCLLRCCRRKKQRMLICAAWNRSLRAHRRVPRAPSCGLFPPLFRQVPCLLDPSCESISMGSLKQTNPGLVLLVFQRCESIACELGNKFRVEKLLRARGTGLVWPFLGRGFALI
jgi:hypothetical protein